MNERTEEIPLQKNRIARFNDGLSYGLNNVFRFVWTITKFFIKISGVLLLLFPIVLVAMCFASPNSAISTLEALMRCIQNVINIFR